MIDEYGGFIGIVTLEDLAEEILGDVNDEHDAQFSEEITATSEDEWLIDGDTPIDEVERAIKYHLPTGDFETISGLLFDHANALVEEGETFRITLEAEPEDYIETTQFTHRILEITVLEVERNVPHKLRLKLIEAAHINDQVQEDR